MIVRWHLAVALVLVAGQAFAQQPVRTAQAPRSKTAPAAAAAPAAGARGLNSVTEKASYSFGMMIGSNLKKQGVEVDLNLFIQGLRDSAGGGKLMLTDQEAAAAIEAFEKQMVAKKAQESIDFLVQNKKRQGVQVTPSGLQYQVVKAGAAKGRKPAKSDAVSVIYRGMFINGEEFDTSGGKPFTIGVGDVITGWQEALQMMDVGSKWRIFVPSELAYGAEGRPPIGPHTTLVFDLELVDIVKAPAAGGAPAAGAAKGRPEQIR